MKKLNNKGEFDGLVIRAGLLILIVILILTGLIYDNYYIYPVATDKANGYCQGLGFDQYKSFSRVGVFSKDPVGIKCEYAERYSDLGVRTTEVGG